MRTLRLVKFDPATNTATRYWETNGFRSCDSLAVEELTPEQQAAVEGALNWAAGRLPTGFNALEMVELQRLSNVEVASEDPESDPVLIPAFAAGITGRGESGERSLEIFSAPGPETAALGQLWDELSV